MTALHRNIAAGCARCGETDPIRSCAPHSIICATWPVSYLTQNNLLKNTYVRFYYNHTFIPANLLSYTSSITNKTKRSLRTHTHTHTHTSMQLHPHTHIHTHQHTHTHTHTHTHARTHTHTPCGPPTHSPARSVFYPQTLTRSSTFGLCDPWTTWGSACRLGEGASLGIAQMYNKRTYIGTCVCI